jgi:YVTN family beta-propeller protein
MNKNQKILKALLLTYFSLLLVLLWSCTTTEEQEDRSRLFNGQVTLFLNGPEKASLDITFDLSAVNIVEENGTSREVMNTPLTINSIDAKGEQIFLGETTLPEGTYNKIQLIVKQSSIKKKGRMAGLALPSEVIEIDKTITVKRKQNTTLFLNWNADASVADGYLFKPVFAVKGQIPELSTLLIYVTNEDSNNVSVIDRQSGEIAATVMVGKKPRGISTSKGGERLKVYVANSGSNSISVIDPTTNKIENEIPIRFGREPQGIAVASISSEKELIFVANYGSNTVSMVDATTYQELEKIDVGRGPIAIEADPPIEILEGTRFLTFEDINVLKSYRERFFNVYVVNHDSNDVSVLRIDAVAKKKSGGYPP